MGMGKPKGQRLPLSEYRRLNENLLNRLSLGLSAIEY